MPFKGPQLSNEDLRRIYEWIRSCGEVSCAELSRRMGYKAKQPENALMRLENAGYLLYEVEGCHNPRKVGIFEK